MEIITATHAARNFAEILNKTHYQGSSFAIRRGNVVLAHIIPATPVIPMKAKDLASFFESLPKLDSEDAKNFARDLKNIRKASGKELNPWD